MSSMPNGIHSFRNRFVGNYKRQFKLTLRCTSDPSWYVVWMLSPRAEEFHDLTYPIPRMMLHPFYHLVCISVLPLPSWQGL